MSRGLSDDEKLEMFHRGEYSLPPLLLHVVTKDKKHVICDYCLRSDKKLKRCASCTKMSYCDKECQKEDWTMHKHECKLLAEHYEEISENNERLLARILLFFTKHAVWLKPHMTDEFALAHDVNVVQAYQDKMAKIDDIYKQDTKGQFAAICAKFEKLNISFEKNQLLAMFCKSFVSSFTMTLADPKTFGSGIGVYFPEIYFPHSRTPSCTMIYNMREVLITTFNFLPISKYQRKTLDYFNLLEPKSHIMVRKIPNDAIFTDPGIFKIGAGIVQYPRFPGIFQPPPPPSPLAFCLPPSWYNGDIQANANAN